MTSLDSHRAPAQLIVAGLLSAVLFTGVAMAISGSAVTLRGQ
jgi:hypothetical protein